MHKQFNYITYTENNNAYNYRLCVLNNIELVIYYYVNINWFIMDMLTGFGRN